MRVLLSAVLIVVFILAACGGDDGGYGCRPEPEVCNGRDDDCDGLADEDLSTDADNDGHFSENSCGIPNDDCDDLDPDIYPGNIELCDGKDNDCDRQTDEDCDCDPGPPPQQEVCSTNQGECTTGTRVCQPNGTWGNCSGQGPSEEICDGLDNDCDGTTDNPETPQPCELTQGVCADATRANCEPCSYGQYYEATEATCDGEDNDCDGFTDEDLSNDIYEPNGNCGQGELPSLEETAIEGSFVMYEGILDLWQLGQPVADTDWYRINLVEASVHVDCLNDQNQCFQFTLRLELPTGEDHTHWEMCAVELSCANFENPTYTFCTQESNWEPTSGSYRMELKRNGRCGDDDGGDFYILVRSAAGHEVHNCRPYKLWLQFWYRGPGVCPP